MYKKKRKEKKKKKMKKKRGEREGEKSACERTVLMLVSNSLAFTIDALASLETYRPHHHVCEAARDDRGDLAAHAARGARSLGEPLNPEFCSRWRILAREPLPERIARVHGAAQEGLLDASHNDREHCRGRVSHCSQHHAALHDQDLFGYRCV